MTHEYLILLNEVEVVLLNDGNCTGTRTNWMMQNVCIHVHVLPNYHRF
jgi:hypothetical protein